MSRFPLVVIDGATIRARIAGAKDRHRLPQGVEILHGQRAYLAGGCHYNADELTEIIKVLNEIEKGINGATSDT